MISVIVPLDAERYASVLPFSQTLSMRDSKWSPWSQQLVFKQAAHQSFTILLSLNDLT